MSRIQTNLCQIDKLKIAQNKVDLVLSMKHTLNNPFLLDKYFEDVKNKKISAQDAVNLATVLANNKLEMFKMIKNAGVTDIKDLYQKCAVKFENITKQKPKANMFAQYALKRPKQEISYAKQGVVQDQRKLPIRKSDSAGFNQESEQPGRRNMKGNTKDYYEKLYNIQEGESQKMIDDLMQMMIIMSEHILEGQTEQEEKQQNTKNIAEKQQHGAIPSADSKNNQIQVEKKRKLSIPQIRIIVASPPKEVQTEPYNYYEEYGNNYDFTKNEDYAQEDQIQYQQQQQQVDSKNNSKFQYNDDDDEVPEDAPHSIIASTLFKFSQSSFDVGRISGHIREHIVHL